MACKCIYGTQTYSFDGEVLPTPMLMPSIVGPRERVEVLNLPMENAEIKDNLTLVDIATIATR